MKVISADEFTDGIYERIENSGDKIILWQHPDTEAWWVVGYTTAHDVPDMDTVVVAFALDRSERSDQTVIRFANGVARRTAHPEDET